MRAKSFLHASKSVAHYVFNGHIWQQRVVTVTWYCLPHLAGC